MRDTTEITVRNGFATDVKFGLNFWKDDKASQVEDVLRAWTQVTGLAFSRMPREDFSGDVTPGNEGFRVIVVEHPLDNRSKVQFTWPTS